MKKIILSIIAIIITISALVTVPVFAEDGSNDCVSTVFFGEVCGDSDGANLIKVLKIVVNILTAAIGALAIGGIAFCGAQYLSAGDNEEKLRKAKRRMFEIIIGLAAYLLLYAILNWLLPDFKGLNV